MLERLAGILSVSKQHFCILHVEEWVRDVGCGRDRRYVSHSHESGAKSDAP